MPNSILPALTRRALLLSAALAPFVAAGPAVAVANPAESFVDDNIHKGLDILRTRGTMVSFGETAGPVPPLDIRSLAPKSLNLARTGLMAFIATTEELRGRAADVFRWVQDGTLTAHYHAQYPMAEAKRAFDALRNRETIGKLLLIP